MSQTTTPKVFRPWWVEPGHMLNRGYELVSDKDGYLKYQNQAGTEAAGYGPMARGKRILYFNTTFQPDKEVVFLGVKEDGDTRTVFHGVVNKCEYLTLILNLVR